MDRNNPTGEFRIRSARLEDAESLLAIYAPYVELTTVSFELEPPTVDEFRRRIVNILDSWAWIVAEREGVIAGYAYGGRHRERKAYQWSFEPSVYVAPAFQRMGVGQFLYSRLFPLLAERGYCQAYAGITLPNDASVEFHRSFGFEPVGIFRSVGWKFGAWHDVSWWHLQIRDIPPGANSDCSAGSEEIPADPL